MSEQEKPHLSASQIDMFLRCGEQYRRRYILKEKVPPAIAMIKGITGHAGAEFNFAQKIESKADLPLKNVQEYASSVFDENLNKSGIELSKEEAEIGKLKVIGEAKDYVLKDVLPLMHKEMFPEYQPIIVESLERLELPSCEYDLLIKMDMATENDIVDYKISGKAKTASEIDSSTQLTCYAAGFRLKYKKDPIIKLEQFINKKKGIERVTAITRRDKNDFRALVSKIAVVSTAIKKNVFLPATAGSWVCSERFCGYFNTCPYVNHGASAS